MEYSDQESNFDDGILENVDDNRVLGAGLGEDNDGHAEAVKEDAFRGGRNTYCKSVRQLVEDNATEALSALKRDKIRIIDDYYLLRLPHTRTITARADSYKARERRLI